MANFFLIIAGLFLSGNVIYVRIVCYDEYLTEEAFKSSKNGLHLDYKWIGCGVSVEKLYEISESDTG